MTDLLKSVKRRTNSTVRDEGKVRRLVITLYPGGVIGLRPEKTRREELLSVEAACATAVKIRVAQERTQKKARRK
jgi:hypothetical protein